MRTKLSSFLLSAVLFMFVGTLGVAPGVAANNILVSFFCYLALIISLQAASAATKLRYRTFVFFALCAVGMAGMATHVSKLAGHWLWMPPWLWIGFMLLAGGLYISLKGKRWIGIISVGGAIVCVLFLVLGPVFPYETPDIASWHSDVILKTALMHMLIVPGGTLLLLLTLLLGVKRLNRLQERNMNMAHKWPIDPSHPFDSIAYIEEKRHTFFGRKKKALVVHRTWLDYLKGCGCDDAEKSDLLKQVAQQQKERHDMKTNKNNAFYGDETGFEQYCRIKYKKLYEHINRMMQKLFAERLRTKTN